MAKLDSGKIIYGKPNARYRALKNLLFNPRMTYDDVNNFRTKYEWEFDNIIRHMYTFIYNSPKIITYLNKYTNNLFFFRKMTFYDFILTLKACLVEHNIFTRNNIYFHNTKINKFELEEALIKKVLSEYFTDSNSREIDFYYQLYMIGVITNEDISEIDYITNGTRTVKLHLPETNALNRESSKNDVTINEIIKIESARTNFLKDYSDELNKYKLSSCSDECPLFTNQMIRLEGNPTEAGEIDLMFINFGPTLVDVKHGRVLRDQTSRNNLELIPEDKKWLIVNLINCGYHSKSAIGNDSQIKQLIDRCSPIFNKIMEDFPSKKYVLIGEEAFNKFLGEEGIEFSDVIGEELQDKYIILAPNVKSSPSTKLKIKMAWQRINNYLNEESIPQEAIICDEEESSKEEEIKEDVIIETKTEKPKLKGEKRLLFNISQLNNKTMLMIYIDEYGNKYYDKKPNMMPGFVYSGDYKDCDVLSSSVDQKFMMNPTQKNELTKILREKIKELKGV